MLIFSSSLKKYIPVIILVLVFPGCGVWEDFTTYFNLYYNTKHKFQEAEDAIKLQRKNPEKMWKGQNAKNSNT